MRRRSPERVRVWRDLLDAWRRSGRTVNAFCHDRKLTRSNFDRWRRILAAEHTRSEPTSASSFVPLRVIGEPMAEVQRPSGILLRLPLASAPDAVTRVVAAVGKRYVRTLSCDLLGLELSASSLVNVKVASNGRKSCINSTRSG
jgi:hypothetical protein